MHTTRAGGLGLLVYGIATPVAFFGTGAPGGSYLPHAVSRFMSIGHAPAAFSFAYLGAFAALGLLVFAHGVRGQLGRAGDVFAGLLLAGCAAGVVGFFLAGGIAVAFAEGGKVVVDGVPHPAVYLISEISNLVAVCASSFFVGVAALVLAARLDTLPRWVRGASYVAGVCGILGPVFFTLWLFWLWAIVTGSWFLRARRVEPARNAPVSATA